MLFALICTDKPGHLQLRLDTRATHLAWLTGLKDKCVVKFAGPFLGEDGKPDGSLVVIAAESAAAAARLAGEDPYALAGLFETVSIRPWNWVINNPES